MRFNSTLISSFDHLLFAIYDSNVTSLCSYISSDFPIIILFDSSLVFTFPFYFFVSHIWRLLSNLLLHFWSLFYGSIRFALYYRFFSSCFCISTLIHILVPQVDIYVCLQVWNQIRTHFMFSGVGSSSRIDLSAMTV